MKSGALCNTVKSTEADLRRKEKQKTRHCDAFLLRVDKVRSRIETAAVINSEMGIAQNIASCSKNKGSVKANVTGSIMPLNEEIKAAKLLFSEACR